MVTLRIILDENVICEDILSSYMIDGKIHGYILKTRLAYYSSLPLSSLKSSELAIDGKTVENNAVSICLDNQCFSIAQLPDLYTRYWYFIDKADLIVNIPDGLPEGDHKVDLKFQMKRTKIYMVPGNYYAISIPKSEKAFYFN